MKKAATQQEKNHMGMVASLNCRCCGAPGPSQVHHIREGQGMPQRASHYLTVALCPDCHVGQNGLHFDKTYMRIYKLTELDMLASTIKEIERLYL